MFLYISPACGLDSAILAVWGRAVELCLDASSLETQAPGKEGPLAGAWKGEEPVGSECSGLVRGLITFVSSYGISLGVKQRAT